MSSLHTLLIERGATAIVSACGTEGPPSLACAAAIAVTEHGTITVYLHQAAAAPVLADLHATGHIAVVVNEASTHRTAQIKARRVTLRAVDSSDEGALLRYQGALAQQLQQVGLGPDHARLITGQPGSEWVTELVAVDFAPELAYEQTPGPNAGTLLPS